jgi:hypothetical protein
MSDEPSEQQTQAAAQLSEARPGVTIMTSASLHPDEAIARCINVIDNMHGSDDQRRKVAASVLDHFSGL